MNVSMLYDKIRWEEKSLVKAAEGRNVPLRMVDAKTLDMDLDAGIPDYMGDITIQRCASYYRGLHATAFLEYKEHKVVNNLAISQTAGNKMLTSLALKKAGVPTPRTSVSTNYETAMKQFSEKFGEVAVIKPVTGSWGRMVALMRDRSAAMAVLEDREYMYPLYSIFYLQEYVKRPPRDLRVFVIGDMVVGGIYRYQASDDWRTNTAIGGRAENCEITSEIEKLALKAADSIGKGIYGVDMMESDEGYLVHELNSSTEFRNTVSVTGVDIPGLIVDYLVELAS